MSVIFSSKSENVAIAPTTTFLQEPKQRIRFFEAYTKNPQGITFTNQEPDETIILLLRRHFITNLPWIITIFLFFLIPPLLFSFFILPYGLMIALTLFYYLITIGYAFNKFAAWFYSISIVTQKRMIVVNANDIGKPTVAALQLTDIVNVIKDEQRLLQNTFNYANILIQTKNDQTTIEIVACPHPSEVVDIMNKLQTMKGDIYGS